MYRLGHVAAHWHNGPGVGGRVADMSPMSEQINWYDCFPWNYISFYSMYKIIWVWGGLKSGQVTQSCHLGPRADCQFGNHWYPRPLVWRQRMSKLTKLSIHILKLHVITIISSQGSWGYNACIILCLEYLCGDDHIRVQTVPELQM